MDVELRPKSGTSTTAAAVNEEESEVEEDQGSDSSSDGGVVRRGRVVVLEIGEKTKKGGYHMKLSRCKSYAVFNRKLSTLCQQHLIEQVHNDQFFCPHVLFCTTKVFE